MKKLLLSALLIAGSAQAGVDIQHWVSPSGARVYFVKSTSLPMLDVQIDFAAGGAYAPAEKSGLAGFTNDLMEAGAGSFDEEAIADKLTATGAQLGNSTDADRASATLRTLTSEKQKEAALHLFETILREPTFPQAVLTREVARAVAGIKEADTQPGSILGKRFAAAVYPGHPYGVTPSVESVSRITRDDLVDFYRKNYCASRAVVTLVGAIERAEAAQIAERLTAKLPTDCASVSIPSPTLPAAQTLRVDHPASQSHVAIGMPSLRRGDPDFYALSVGNYVLGGGGFVSRMLKEVREKRGLAYSAYSYFAPAQAEGLFQIGLQTKAEQTDEALKVARDTLDAFLAKGPTAEELKDAKRNIINGFVLRVDSNRKLLDVVSVIGFYKLPLDYLDTYPARIEAVSAAQIREAFGRRVKPEHLVTVIVGPVAKQAAESTEKK
ncbi:MAG: hypothetical protein RIR70_2227 [Pseudomonadota bacterium]